MEERFSRSEQLLGVQAMERLMGARVAVVGIGGVGSFVTEALIRGGVGHLLLVDHDVVAPSNCNRQLHAMEETVGQYKTKLMAHRAQSVNPAVQVETLEEFVTPNNCSWMMRGRLDYIVDAVDNITAKIALAMLARERGVPIISVMGTGNKQDPARFRTGDLFNTEMCPLCRVMRRELKQRGIDKLMVVWSDEPPLMNLRPPGSVSFVPPVAGMIAAGVVIKGLVEKGEFNE